MSWEEDDDIDYQEGWEEGYEEGRRAGRSRNGGLGNHRSGNLYSGNHHSGSGGSGGTNGGCYVATCVYGSYDCPEVWTLRRFRDDRLAKRAAGRAVIRVYYALSPGIVRRYGAASWFRRFWRWRLDALVKRLAEQGVADTPYRDKAW
ncbi:MAG: CFI-box-CTERM domain-containing protein [Oscillibacter sp.]|nr:CFI-box-CTERM domain-containing protein [Oscillibacter sp.]